MLSFIFTLFDLYEKYVNKGMGIRILMNNFNDFGPICMLAQCVCWPNMYVNMYVNFVCKHTHIFEMMRHLYLVLINYLTISMYTM